jgi:cation transport regulator ChaB
MRVDHEKLNELTRAIYAAAFVKVLDEKRLRAGSREQKAAALQAHEFAVAAVVAFTGVTGGP